MQGWIAVCCEKHSEKHFMCFYLISSRIVLLPARHICIMFTESYNSCQKARQECHSISFVNHTYMRAMSCLTSKRFPDPVWPNVQNSASSCNKWRLTWSSCSSYDKLSKLQTDPLIFFFNKTKFIKDFTSIN